MLIKGIVDGQIWGRVVLALALAGCSAHADAPDDGGTSNSHPQDGNVAMPNIDSIDPSVSLMGEPPPTLTVKGSGFQKSSYVAVNKAKVPTKFVDETTLRATVPAWSVETAGVKQLAVYTGDQSSASVTFRVDNPVPVLETFDPPAVEVGSDASTIRIDGRGIAKNAEVLLTDGTSLGSVQVQSALSLTFGLTKEMLKKSRPLSIVVRNPAPGGGTSESRTFSIIGGMYIDELTPSSTSVGWPSSITLGVTGTGFDESSDVFFNGERLPTTRPSTTRLTAVIPASKFISTGSYPITVQAPDERVSRPLNFNVVNPAPQITNLDPPSVAIHSIPDININGSNFVVASRVRVNGYPVETMFLSTHALNIRLPASYTETEGSYKIEVVTPGPGGGVSNPATLAVTRLSCEMDPVDVALENAGQSVVLNLNYQTGYAKHPDYVHSAPDATCPASFSSDLASHYSGFVIQNRTPTTKKFSAWAVCTMYSDLMLAAYKDWTTVPVDQDSRQACTTLAYGNMNDLHSIESNGSPWCPGFGVKLENGQVVSADTAIDLPSCGTISLIAQPWYPEDTSTFPSQLKVRIDNMP